MQSIPSFRRALLTGATGFIGSSLLRRLQTAGWEVHLLVRAHSDMCQGVECHLYGGEISEVIEALERSRPDVVFHLASLFLAQHTPEQVTSLVQSNVLFGAQILEAMSLTDTRALVNAGTSWQHFQSESYRPVNLYAATKQAFEDILAYYADAFDIRAITLSLFDSYGPKDTRKKLLKLLLDCLHTGNTLEMSAGNQIIDLVHVEDLSAAFLRAAALVQDPAQPAVVSYAVSGEERRTLREIVAIFEGVARCTLPIQWGARPYRPREVMQLWDGPVLPGWQPMISLAEGFQSLLLSEKNR